MEPVPIKIMQMIKKLHDQGFENIYLYSGMAPTGLHWRYTIGLLEYGRWPNNSIIVAGSIGSEGPVEWSSDCSSTEILSKNFQDKFNLEKTTPNPLNEKYKAWYSALLSMLEHNEVLTFFADYQAPHEYLLRYAPGYSLKKGNLIQTMITGHCLCGNIHYQYPSEPLFQLVCCCEDCQRASGSSHVPVVGVTKKDFKVNGKTKTFISTGGSGKQAIRHFCPDCGSLLFGTPESDPDLVTIYAGTIDSYAGSTDRDFVFTPTHAINTKAKAHWEVFADSIIQIKGMPR